MTDSLLFNANASLNSMIPINKGDAKNPKPHHQATGLTKWQLSNKTHRSKTDPEATLAVKLGTTRSLKYKAHVCCDGVGRVIMAIRVTTGSVHDSQPYLDLLAEIETKLQLTIQEVIADRAYGSGHILSALQAKGITSFIPLFTTRTGKSTQTVVPGFYFDLDKNTYICPANIAFKGGKINTYNYIIYRSSTKDCRQCQLKANCQAPTEKNRETKRIACHIHEAVFQHVKLSMQTALFKQKLGERLWKIEGIMNELKNYHTLNRAKYRGLANVQIQAYMAAMVINIKRIILLLWIITLLEINMIKI